MKILLIQLLSYASNHKGGPKANRLLMEQLVGRGHTCAALLPYTHEESRHFESTARLEEIGIDYERPEEGMIRFSANGVEVHAFETTFDPAALDFTKVLRMMENAEKIGKGFAPDVILVSSDDFNNFMLETAFRIRPDRVVFVAHTIQEVMTAFGPHAAKPDERRHELLRKCAGRIAPSNYLAKFMQDEGGVETTVLSFPAYGEPPFADRSSYDEGYVTMISPSVQKGLALFEELTKALPGVDFGVVLSSVSTPEDVATIERLPNVSVLPFAQNIDDVFEQTRVLLVPSLGFENFPLVVVEAMLRGIPVLGSNRGGVPEAKLGVEYVLPVAELRVEQNPPGWIYTAPKQDPGPWAAALEEILGDRARYEDISRRSRQAAHDFLDVADVRHFEAFLEGICSRSGEGTT